MEEHGSPTKISKVFPCGTSEAGTAQPGRAPALMWTGKDTKQTALPGITPNVGFQLLRA